MNTFRLVDISEVIQKIINKKAFYTLRVSRLNDLLTKVGYTHRYGVFAWEKLYELQQEIEKTQLPIIVIHLDNNGVPNMEGIDPNMLEKIHGTIIDNIRKRKELVQAQQYEKAARFRDSEKVAFEKMLEEIKLKLQLTDGINYHKGKLVIVKPKDVNKAKALSSVLKNLNVSGINF